MRWVVRGDYMRLGCGKEVVVLAWWSGVSYVSTKKVTKDFEIRIDVQQIG